MTELWFNYAACACRPEKRTDTLHIINILRGPGFTGDQTITSQAKSACRVHKDHAAVSYARVGKIQQMLRARFMYPWPLATELAEDTLPTVCVEETGV